MLSASYLPISNAPRPDLERRLARRRSLEQDVPSNAHKNNNPVVLQMADRVAPLLALGLRTCGLYARGRANALSPLVRHLRFELPSLPPAFDGFRILFLADLHIDGIPELPQVLAGLLATVPADLCALGGDYRFRTLGTCDAVFPGMQTVVDAIQSKHGIVGILGNHDAAEIAPGLERLGVRMLVNEAVEIQRGADSIHVIGVDDPYLELDDLPAALENVPLDGFKLLLAHTPQMAEEAAHSGIDVYLCGHTHGGQVRLPLVGALVNNGLCPRSRVQGAWRAGRVQGYTSAGLGCSMMPVRFNCPPEVVVVELVRQSTLF